MTRAVVVVFHKYNYGKEGLYYQPMFDCFLKGLELWEDECNTLYFVDSFWNLSLQDTYRLLDVKKDTIILKTDDQSHTPHKQYLLDIREDSILKLDHDVIIYRKGVIDSWFSKVEEGYDLVTALDGGASEHLRSVIHQKYPFLKEHDVSRIGSPYYLFTKKLLQKLPIIDFSYKQYHQGDYIAELECSAQEGDWLESYHLFTFHLLEQKPNIFIIDDDRSSIYLREKKFVKSPEIGKDLGYYHIRGGVTPIGILEAKMAGRDEYSTYLNQQPQDEYLRHFAWYAVLASHSLVKYQVLQDIQKVLAEINIDKDLWQKYLTEFVAYHGLREFMYTGQFLL